MPPALSARLEAIARFVLPGHPMADIGTDHAMLPATLVARGTVPRAIACDVLAGPLEAAARTLVRSATADRIELRRGDGLGPLADGEVATIVIAGMGGRSIADILEGHLPTGTRRLVLQPNRGVATLRRRLDGAGWRIVDEEMIEEAERFYPVVVAEPGTEPFAAGVALSERELVLGPILCRDPSPAMRAWAAEERDRTQRKLAGLARAKRSDLGAVERARRRLQILAEVLADGL